MESPGSISLSSTPTWKQLTCLLGRENNSFTSRYVSSIRLNRGRYSQRATESRRNVKLRSRATAREPKESFTDGLNPSSSPPVAAGIQVFLQHGGPLLQEVDLKHREVTQQLRMIAQPAHPEKEKNTQVVFRCAKK